ncbi:MAG: DUF4105 domain-containing protein [Flammeovirgaceae bacterium]|nr:DUF4105 domain-containing protein [Flammeovirgaceae bacterium]
MKLNLSLVRSSLFFILCIISFSLANAQAKLSPRAKISIFTIGQGGPQDELFTQFGHSGIRVNDPLNRIDWVYDYGVFDFDEPFFYLKFARGQLKYRLAKAEYERFEYRYKYYNRDLTEQVLNLDSAQKQVVFDFLEENYKPENRYYLYDFFYDNCATKLPTVVKTALGDEVDFNNSPPDEALSFRQLIQPDLETHPWGDLGIDLALGLPCDKIASRWQYMFLPQFVKKGFEEATIKRNGKLWPLVAETNIVNEHKPWLPYTPSITPSLIFWIVFALVAIFSVLGILKNKRFKAVDFILFFSMGMVGMLIVFLWFLTDHKATANNFNILWGLPTHVFLAFALLKKQPSGWVKGYLIFTIVLDIIILAGWNFLPQALHFSIIPIVLALLVRAGFNYQVVMK